MTDEPIDLFLIRQRLRNRLGDGTDLVAAIKWFPVALADTEFLVLEYAEKIVELRAELASLRASVQTDKAKIVATTLEWAMDEILWQDAAHDDVISLDLTDHIRCFVTQPERGSLVPWPADLPRPISGASSSPVPVEETQT